MNTTRLLSVSLGFALALVIAAACTTPDDRNTGSTSGKDAGVTTDAGETADAGTNADAGSQTTCGDVKVSSDPACQTCMEGNCCSELEACAAGTACDAVIACLKNCDPSDQTCQQQCVNDNRDGMPAYQEAANCSQNSCGTECGGGSSGTTHICDSGLDAPNAACGTCLTNSCCAEMTTCVNDETCLACATSQTMTGCDTNMAFVEALNCVNTHCGTECK